MRSRPPDSKARLAPQRPPLPPKGLWPPTLPTMTLRTQRAPEPPLAFTWADAEELRAQDVWGGAANSPERTPGWRVPLQKAAGRGALSVGYSAALETSQPEASGVMSSCVLGSDLEVSSGPGAKGAGQVL